MIGCSGVQIDPPEARSLVGSCQRLIQPAYLIEHGRYVRGGFAGEHLILTADFLLTKDKIVGPLESGTRFTVRRVLKDKNLTASCWRIEVVVTSGPLAGRVSELPACYESHPPTWLNSDGPIDVVEQLKIQPQYAVPCD
jgi:hypothetical protein